MREREVNVDAMLHTLSKITLTALAQTALHIADERFAIVAVASADRAEVELALGERRPLIAIDDGIEFTIVLPEPVLSFALPHLSLPLRAESGYRFIHLRAELPWDIVGYGAAIFSALAGRNISAGFYSGYAIDYLLVRDERLDETLAALLDLFADAQRLLETRDLSDPPLVTVVAEVPGAGSDLG